MAFFPNYVCGSTSGSESSWVVTMFDTGVDELLEAGDARLDLYEGMVPGSLKLWEGRTGGTDYDFTDRFRVDVLGIANDFASKLNDPNIPTNPSLEVGSQYNRSGYTGGNAVENFAVNQVADFALGYAEDAINQGFRDLVPGQGIFGIGIHDMGVTPDGELSLFTGAWYNFDWCSDNEITGQRRETTVGLYIKREDKTDIFSNDVDMSPGVDATTGGGSTAFGGTWEILDTGPNSTVSAKLDANVQKMADGKQTTNASAYVSIYF